MKNKRIACIDGDSILYICLNNKIKYDSFNNPIIDDFGNKVKEDKSFEDCKNHLDLFISTLIEDTNSTHYIIALTIGRNFRYSIDANYKINRAKLKKPEYFYKLRDYMVDKYKAIHNIDLEADDICLILSKNLSVGENHAFIASLDTDLLKLEGTHYDYKKRCWIETSKDESDHKFWTDMIVGQSGDNIKGIPGKGEVFAKAIIGQFGVTRHSTHTYPDSVLCCYIEKFGEELGISEFYKNYKLLKIKDSWEGFIIPEPIRYKKVDNLDNNKIINF